jgi:glycine/D-amino acid oxidase-like deaminating enzyme
MLYDFAIIGGGIVGISTARTLMRMKPDSKVIVCLRRNPNWQGIKPAGTAASFMQVSTISRAASRPNSARKVLRDARVLQGA